MTYFVCKSIIFCFTIFSTTVLFSKHITWGRDKSNSAQTKKLNFYMPKTVNSEYKLIFPHVTICKRDTKDIVHSYLPKLGSKGSIATEGKILWNQVDFEFKASVSSTIAVLGKDFKNFIQLIIFWLNHSHKALYLLSNLYGEARRRS